MYRGQQPIKEAPGFIQRLRQAHKSFIFLTNNSTGFPSDKVDQLQSVGVEAFEHEIYTSAMATADYVASLGFKRVYPVGEKGLIGALESKGLVYDDQSPDCVVVGLDRQVTYAALETATLLIRKGARFIATNKDANIPTERGMSPSNGALISFIETATAQSAQVVGKPESIMMDRVVEKLGCERSEILVVGDNYDTDILAGIQNDMDTLLVLSGFTTREAVVLRQKQPTYIVSTLDDWMV